MKRLGALALLAATLVVPPTGADAANPAEPGQVLRCEGKRATIVGPARPGGRIEGTNGPDVIVARGARSVDAKGGRDLICVTGHRRRTDVDAGAGDDVVRVARTVRGITYLRPGPGNDVVHGGAARDFVDLGSGAGRDRISTGPGDDTVTMSEPAARPPGGGSRDVIRLGAGDDRLRPLTSSQFLADGTVADGGPGRDRLEMGGRLDFRDLTLDLAEGTTSGTYEQDTPWAVRTLTFEEVFLVGGELTEITVRGSEADEVVITNPSPVEADLGAGDDELWLLGTVPDFPADAIGTYVGGDGSDLVDFGAGSGSIVADLGAGTAQVVDQGEAVPEEYTFTDFEGARAEAFDSVDITGSAGPDRIEVDSCLVQVDAGDGDDVVLSLGRTVVSNTCPASAMLTGGPGDDDLVGGAGDDVITGGDGDDTADGRGGVDTCDAETVRNCED